MKSLVNTLVPFFSALALLVLVTGCDTESAGENNVLITPLNATIAAGESITFTASGGFDYRWSLESDGGEWATLSNYEGSSTTYTSLRNSSSNSVATVKALTVSSYIEGSGGSSNQTDATYAETHTAEAYISHIVDPSLTASSSPLRISPESLTLSAGNLASFTVSGGSGTYSWTISPATYGSLSSSSGDTTTYSATTSISAQVVLTVSSGSENEAAIITQTP